MAFLWLATSAASAAEVELLEVTREEGRIYIRASIVMDAPRAEVFRVLSDYDRIHELSKRYEESRFIEPAADGTPRVYSKARGCVWFFCRSVERYAGLSVQPDTTITLTVEPENSDMDYGVEVWELEALGLQTRVFYRHEAEPKFWVPPVIGVPIIRRILNKDALSSSQAIEQMASQLLEGMDTGLDKQPVSEGARSDE